MTISLSTMPLQVINLLGFICIEASGFPFHSRGAWFNTVAMGGFWITGFLLAFYIFHVVEKFFRIPWLKIEFVYCALWTVFYLTAACLAVTLGNEAYVVAGVSNFVIYKSLDTFCAFQLFGFCGLAAYAFDAYLKYKAVKSGELAQGDRVISKQTTTMSSPAY